MFWALELPLLPVTDTFLDELLLLDSYDFSLLEYEEGFFCVGEIGFFAEDEEVKICEFGEGLVDVEDREEPGGKGSGGVGARNDADPGGLRPYDDEDDEEPELAKFVRNKLLKLAKYGLLLLEVKSGKRKRGLEAAARRKKSGSNNGIEDANDTSGFVEALEEDVDDKIGDDD